MSQHYVLPAEVMASIATIIRDLVDGRLSYNKQTYDAIVELISLVGNSHQRAMSDEYLQVKSEYDAALQKFTERRDALDEFYRNQAPSFPGKEAASLKSSFVRARNKLHRIGCALAGARSKLIGSIVNYETPCVEPQGDPQAGEP